jgi:hypothetical protein
MMLGLAAIVTQMMHLALVLAMAPVLVGLVRLTPRMKRRQTSTTVSLLQLIHFES